MEIWQVMQNPVWACPGMLVFVQDGFVVGQQTNADNDLTTTWAEEEGNWGKFDPNNYQCAMYIGTR